MLQSLCIPLTLQNLLLAAMCCHDASSWLCRVTVFAMANEDSAKGSKLTPTKQAATPGIIYDQGVSSIGPNQTCATR